MSDRLLTDWLTAFMEYTENSEPPRLFRLWTGISTIAACLKRKCTLYWERPTYPNMYIVIVGPAGCRKGTAMGFGMRLLDEIGIKVAADSTTREALIKNLANASELLISDNPAEKQRFHCSMTIYSDELTVFLGYNNQQLMADLCKWWDCQDKFRYETISRGENAIYGVWVNLIGGTTPTLLASTLPKDSVGGGFTSRTIFVYGDRKEKIVPCPFPTSRELELYRMLALDLERISTYSGQFSVSDSWIDRYVPWYEQHSRNPPFQNQNLATYNERRQTHLIKLCMILSVSRNGSLVIEEEDFTRAVDILTQTEKRMPEVFAGFGKNRDAEVMNRIMQTIGANGRVTFAELVRLYHQDADKETIARVIATLESMGFCRLVVAGKDSYIEHLSKKEK